MIFKTPKISDKPDAMRNRNIAVVRPERSCPSRKNGSSNSDMPRAPERGWRSTRQRRIPKGGSAQNAPSETAGGAFCSATASSVHERLRIDVLDARHDRVSGRALFHLAVELPAVGLMV